MIAVIDYDAGNLKSVEKALAFIGGEPVVTRDKDKILAADHIILPGVGAFGQAMEQLRSYDLEDVIHVAVDKNKPFLGICLGLQMLFESSEETPGVEGLSLLKGTVKRFPDEGLKIPHMGWNNLQYPNQGRLFKDIPEEAFVYFVHSYYLEAADENIVKATTRYGSTCVHASVEKGNLFACQFHPEKSSKYGLQILENFLKVRGE